MKLCLIFAALFVAAIAGDPQCGCTPQPITIQLSCNGGQQGQAPAPAPAPEPEEPEADWNITEDPDRSRCGWHAFSGLDNNRRYAAPGNDLPGGFPEQFLVEFKNDGSQMKTLAGDDNPVPPPGWDGRVSTLGFPLPQKGSQHYNMLLCWPELEGFSLRESQTVFNDPRREQCQIGWMDASGFPYIYMPLHNIDNTRLPDGYTIELGPSLSPAPDAIINTPEGLSKPPMDWDGNPATLGFPMPEPGSEHYNMLLCWPYHFKFSMPFTLEAPEGQKMNIFEDPDRQLCDWTSNCTGNVCYQSGDVEGGFPDQFGGYRVLHGENGETMMYGGSSSQYLKRPPVDWNGDSDTLGYSMPVKGTKHYNMLLCWITHEPQQNNPPFDEDRWKCKWHCDKPKRCRQIGELPGGFPEGFELIDRRDEYVPDTESPIEQMPGWPRPPYDWNGNPNNLGFPMPEKGTALYNMLMCWTYPENNIYMESY